MSRFLREIQASSRVTHPNIIKILLGAGPWRLAIRFQIIQDMMAWTKYANFPQVGFRYRRKR